MSFKVVYTADIHGNLVQYKKLVDCALKLNTDAVIIGGDVLPKGLPSGKFISEQKKFIEDELPKIFSPLKNKTSVYLMMGNDDCSINFDLLKSKEKYNVIHTPPDNTVLDVVMNGSHVGSMAVKCFIEERQPFLTLHSHIHETVYKSGAFK